MSGKLQDKVACITGAASGIGRATALLLAREGAIVVATDIQADKGPSLIAEIEGTGRRGCFLAHDVAEEDQWRAVVAEIHARYGRLDILVNNAGVGYAGPVTEMSLELWRRQMAINVDGVFLGMKHSLPLMREHQAGSIINISSVAGLKGSPNMSGYCATKGAVRLMTKSVAMECANAKDGIRVNSMHPGIIETPIWDSIIGTGGPGDNARPQRDLALDALTETAVPLGVKGFPLDIANGILWLASDESRYVTGAEMVIDGGLTVR